MSTKIKIVKETPEKRTHITYSVRMKKSLARAAAGLWFLATGLTIYATYMPMPEDVTKKINLAQSYKEHSETLETEIDDIGHLIERIDNKESIYKELTKYNSDLKIFYEDTNKELIKKQIYSQEKHASLMSAVKESPEYQMKQRIGGFVPYPLMAGLLCGFLAIIPKEQSRRESKK